MTNDMTAAATKTTFKLGEIVNLDKMGTVRIVRIVKGKGGYVGVQDAKWPVIDGVEPWMFGFTTMSVQQFCDSYRKAN